MNYRKVTTGDFRATDRARQLVNEVLDSGRIGYGEKSKEFEKKFAALHGCRYGILSNSGTSSLHVALQALKELHGWGDGDRVIVPATTFVATANIVRHNKLVPSFVDVSPDTFNIDESLIEREINRDTRAIIPVHLFGQPANLKAIRSLARQYNLSVIEDSCETMFVRQAGELVGSVGDIGCFSMYVAHLIVTGVGGIATTNNPDYAAKMRSLVNHGLDIDFLNVDDNFAPQPMLNRRFRFNTIGHSFRITEFEAAVGLAQLDQDYITHLLQKRARHAIDLILGIGAINKIHGGVLKTQVLPPGTEHARMMFPIVVRDEQLRDPLLDFLYERGIETRDMLPILNQPIYKWLAPRDFPVSDMLVRCGFYVGCHQYLENEDIQHILASLEEFFDLHS